MTRFARAKGSKASNERVPEEATSWSEMKQQLLEKTKELEQNEKRKDAVEKRNANYKAFLEEREKDSRKNASWAEFPGTSAPIRKEKNKKKRGELPNTENIFEKSNEVTPRQEENDGSKRDTFLNVQDIDSDGPPEEESSKNEVKEPIVKKKKVKPKKLLKIASKDNNSIHEENTAVAKKRTATENGGSIKKKFKKGIENNNTAPSMNKKKPGGNKQKQKVVKENLTEQDLQKIEKKRQRRIKQVEKRKQIKEKLKQQKEEETKTQENNNIKIDDVQVENQNSIKPIDKLNGEKHMERKKKKVRDKEEHPRRKPFLPHKMFINGKELEIDYVEGFPVKKEDALRLKKLRREMISKGLPRSEINISLKLERRKAEKALTREKKKVRICLNKQSIFFKLEICCRL